MLATASRRVALGIRAQRRPTSLSRVVSPDKRQLAQPRPPRGLSISRLGTGLVETLLSTSTIAQRG